MKNCVFLLAASLIFHSVLAQTTLPIPAVTTGQSNNYFRAGTGDGGDLLTYNSFLRLHSGLAIGSPFVSNGSGGYIEKATISFHGRTGDINTLGSIITSGKVSIGFGATPKNVLDVMGGFEVSTETQMFVGQDHNFGANTGRYGIGLSLKHNDGTSAGKVGYLNIWTSNQQKRVMTFDYLGNVGIGTTLLPDAKLCVKGTIHTNEVKVDLLGAVVPDYVFENTYKLSSLIEIQSYINQNKHLPEVPSAKEMEEI
jgi:hypothetical protein